VYTVSRDARVFCLDGATGKMIWGRELSKDLGLKSPEWGFAGSPLLWGSRVVLNLGTAGVALDQATGRTVWDTGAEPSGYASPVLYTRAGGKPTLAMFGAKGFLARDAATGAALWDYPWETQYNINAADPLIADGKAFITSGYGRGCALLDISKDQPRELWTGKAVSSQFSSVVLWKGCLYGVNGNVGRGDVRCLDFQTGEMKWSDEGSLGFGSLILADGKLIVLSEKGELAVVAASPDGCNALLRGRVLGGTCWTPPVLCDGLIYCRNDRGDLACVRVGAAGQ
jgi:outer membrane protein assembly factor BamB